MTKLIIDQVKYQRIILHISGHVEDVETLEGARFYLREQKQKRELDIEAVETEGNRFRLRINVMELDGEYPIRTGKWYLRADIGDEKRLRDYVSDPVYDQVHMAVMDGIKINFVMDNNEGESWQGISALNTEDWTYYLDVTFIFPEQLTGFRKFTQQLKETVYRQYRSLATWGFHVAFNIFNNKPKKGNQVFFTSDRTNELAGNEKFVYERMLERGLGDKYIFRFSFKDGIKARRSFREKFRFTHDLATSDVIFTDDYQPELYKNEYDPDVKLVQLWHACGAFKTIGFERLGKKGAPMLLTSSHKNYTHVIVSSEHSARHNAEAFALSESRFYPVGIPRTDVFFDREYLDRTAEKVRTHYPQLPEAKKVILYAPTFRGNNARSASFPLQIINFHILGDFLRDKGYCMMIKLHPFVKSEIRIPQEYQDYFIDATDYPDINELLTVTDVLVTDYSSVIYEAALLNIPMLFFAFDLDNYNDDRGFYEPYEEIVPGKIVKTLRALVEAIGNEDYEAEKLQGFLTKNFRDLDGHSTDRVIDLIFGNDDGNSLA